jgi:hypothetical protein
VTTVLIRKDRNLKYWKLYINHHMITSGRHVSVPEAVKYGIIDEVRHFFPYI